MSYNPRYKDFIFERYAFDEQQQTATFEYSFDGDRHFKETVKFGQSSVEYDKSALNSALFMAFIIVGTSYYKCFPTKNVMIKSDSISLAQAIFFTKVFKDGLSQFIYENKLAPNDVVSFDAEFVKTEKATEIVLDEKLLLLQSGGKDSLLLATLLKESNKEFYPWYMSSTGHHPEVLNRLNSQPLRSIKRTLDREGLRKATDDGGLNGHVPVTYITLSFAIIDAILHGENTVLTAIGHEGAEAHVEYKGISINHQWSKTWEAEVLMRDYVTFHVSPSIRVGSPLRGFTELRIAELFVKYSWQDFGHLFSSCNVGNYKQGKDNTHLSWCGDCSKCANSFLLFAPFVEPAELQALFGGQNMLEKNSLLDDFKGLLGINGAIKPFECVGEIDELRLAYQMARDKYGAEHYSLPFDVPASDFDYLAKHEAQNWAESLVSNLV